MIFFAIFRVRYVVLCRPKKTVKGCVTETALTQPQSKFIDRTYLGARLEYNDFFDQRRHVFAGCAMVGWIGRVDDLEHATVGRADEQDVVGLAVGRGDLAVNGDLTKLDRVPAYERYRK